MVFDSNKRLGLINETRMLLIISVYFINDKSIFFEICYHGSATKVTILITNVTDSILSVSKKESFAKHLHFV